MSLVLATLRRWFSGIGLILPLAADEVFRREECAP